MKLRTFISFIAAALISVTISSGCDSKEKHETEQKFDLVATKDGIVYRINKQTGEVFLIAAQSATIVQGTENVDSVTNGLQDWPTISADSIGDVKADLKVDLKTKWRDGKMYFLFTASPVDHFKSFREAAPPKSQFVVSIADEDGFEIINIPIKLADMRLALASDGKSEVYGINTFVVCDSASYKTLDVWLIALARM